MSNKNSSGIDDYLNTQKLFAKDSRMHSKAGNGFKKTDSNVVGRSNLSKGYQYHLLNTPLQQSTTKSQKDYKQKQPENKQSPKGIDLVFKYESELKKKEQIRYTYVANTSQEQKNNQEKQQNKNLKRQQYIPVDRKKSAEKKKDSYQVALQEQQSPIAWQSIVINSSRKYFDSCRMEALNFIKKLQDMLKKQKNYIHNQLNKINQLIEQSHTSLAQTLKEYLYKLIDQAVQQWRNDSLGKFQKSKIQYVGELYELNTQVEQRHKQILIYNDELNNQKQWRHRASDLLTSNYEANVVELSKQCKKSVENTNDNLHLYFNGVETKLKQKFNDREFSSDISKKISQILKKQFFKNPQQLQKQKQRQKQRQIQLQLQKIRKLQQERHIKQRELFLKQTYDHYRYPRNLTTALKGHQKFLKNHIHICQICHQQIGQDNSKTPNTKQINTSRFYSQNLNEQMDGELKNKDQVNKEGQNTRIRQFYNQPNEKSSSIKVTLYKNK